MTTLPEGETENCRYDEAGRLMQKDGREGPTGYGYNMRDKVTSVTDALGNCTHYTYDRLGNLTELRRPVQEAAGLSGIRYRYDALDLCLCKAQGALYRQLPHDALVGWRPLLLL